MRTQVAIIGAGPAGLMLARLLRLAGIESVVLEARDRPYVEHRVRAGVLEQFSTDLLNDSGIGERMNREGLVHDGVELRFGGVGHRINFQELIGKGVTVYGQHEVVKDLLANRIDEEGLPVLFDVSGVRPADFDTDRPKVYFTHEGVEQVLECDFIAGCDGFHGPSRDAIPNIEIFERVYPFAWLGILADAAPVHDELIYSNTPEGFALYSMRSSSVTRLYLQCEPDEDLALWPDERVWAELDKRLGGADGFKPLRGPITQKSVTAMRSFVAEPMQNGRLFLSGDSAHIVPPTGAKGMNLAFTDVYLLSRALSDFYTSGSQARLGAYSDTCLRRIWKVQRFSWWMTTLLHRFPDENAFDHRRQLAELDYITTSKAAAITLAENYVGLPLDD